jgi:lactaldehyde dehydrogenase/glycolaldehyde dehydrogenase
VSTTVPGSLYINGKWDEGSGPRIDDFDPSDASVIVSIPSATEAEVGSALQAARDAKYEWAHALSTTRGAYLRQIADLVRMHADTFARLLVLEVGKPLAQAHGEVDFAESLLRYNAEWDRRLEGDILPGDYPNETIHLLREPLGVVAAICPWNFPLAVLCRKLAPALITGNTLVAKPSEVTPLSTIELFRLIDEELDLPDGVLGLVCGGGETGQAMVKSPLTNLISFTGHRDTGKRIMAQASEHLTRVSLELGGKAPVIVAADADMETAIPAIVAARITNAGQVCTAAERVFVDQRIADDFTERYVAATAELVIGHPSGNVDIGPLVSQGQFDKTVAAIAIARQQGAQVVAGGGRPDGSDFANGYWQEPTVLRGLHNDMSIMREETFGPVTPILEVGSAEEALTLANDSNYGLSAYVFSQNYSTVMKTVEDLDFGEIYINRTNGETVHAHHAGYKESGMGGEDGKWGMLRYTQIKTAYHRYG